MFLYTSQTPTRLFLARAVYISIVIYALRRFSNKFFIATSLDRSIASAFVWAAADCCENGAIENISRL
jgi:hypothetical protein